MTETKEEILRRTIRVIHDLKQKLADSQEPIAIVGMACRLPGRVMDPVGFWKLLQAGGDAISPMPNDRWDVDAIYSTDPLAAGTTYAKEGGFLEGLDLFDAGFFGVSPQEAVFLEPQQRLVLEVAWEALENAGIDPLHLRGSDMGIYLGAQSPDYRWDTSLEELDGHWATGRALSVLSGRLAYVLGLHGPALTVDTACSSSLVAIHLACQGLRHGDCTSAMVGGVATMTTPQLFVEFSRLQAMARDGRCKAFSASADGAGWSEGCVLLVLERLSTAQQARHSILALILGSSVNQDGRSQGLTAPSGPAQQRVIRQALAHSGLEPDSIDYIEAHGTGTQLGDPIEAGALHAIFSQHRGGRPLYLGSAKSNVGHTMTAAGAVGVAKVVLALNKECIPKTLYADPPNKEIPWGEGLRLVQESTDWPRGQRVRRAGVSSFGFSGTNAHVVLEEAPPPADVAPSRDEPGPQLLVISGRTEAALRELATRYATHLRTRRDLHLADICYSAALHRPHLDCRLSVVGSCHEEVAATLTCFAANGSHRASTAKACSRPRVLFLFTGSAHPRIAAAELLTRVPAFRASMEAWDSAIVNAAGWSVIDAIHSSTDALEKTSLIAMACSVALSAAWRHWGISPNQVMGLGFSEIAAAHVAGLISAEDVVQVCSLCNDLFIRQKATEPDIKQTLLPALRSIRHARGTIPLLSSVSGRALSRIDLDADYWQKCLAVTPHTFLADEPASTPHVIIDIGFHAAAPSAMITALVAAHGKGAVAIDGIEKDSGYQSLLSALGAVHTLGLPVDWRKVVAGKFVELPNYPFQRQRYWSHHWGGRRPNEMPLATRCPLFEIKWKRGGSAGEMPQIGSGSWIVVGDGLSGEGTMLSDAIRHLGGSAVQVPWRSELDDVKAEVQRCLNQHSGPVRLLSLVGLQEMSWRDPSHPPDVILANLELARLIAQSPADVSWWLATRGVVGLDQASPPEGDSLQASLWGLGRSFALEHPDKWGGVLDLPLTLTSATAQRTIESAITSRDEDEFAIRSDGVFHRRLSPFHPGDGISAWSTGGRALITGLGTVGRQLAHALVDRGVSDIVMISRRGLETPGAPAIIEELTARKCRAQLASVDVTNASAMATWVEELEADGPPITAVFHTAAVHHDGVISQIEQSMFLQVIRPRLIGLQVLNAIFSQRPLDAFVVVTTLSGILGDAGASAAAAANAALSAFPQPCGGGGRLLAIGWPEWATPKNIARVEKNAGREVADLLMDPRLAVDALFTALAVPPPHRPGFLIAASFDWNVAHHLLGQLFSCPPTADLCGQRTVSDKMELDPVMVSTLPEQTRKEQLVRVLQKLLARALMISDLSQVNTTTTFQDLGVDSLANLGFRNMIREAIGIPIHLADLVQAPTLDSLGEFLARDLPSRIATSGKTPAAELAPRTSQGISPPQPRPVQPSPRVSTSNTPADPIFILSSARAGSTLLRVMLAGHEELFAPPELFLLPYETLQQRHDALIGDGAHWAVTRAIMELWGKDRVAAEARMESWIANSYSTERAFRLLIKKAHPRRLVEKSPINAQSIAFLQRAAAWFPNAHYIHLVRHPNAVIESFVRVRLDRMNPSSSPHAEDPWAAAEDHWVQTNSNIQRFLKEIPAAQKHCLRYEDVVDDPEKAMQTLLPRLGLDFSEAVLRPYEPGRMTDGLGGEPVQVGDPNFHQYQGIDSRLARRWQHATTIPHLAGATRALALALGYLEPDSVLDPSISPDPHEQVLRLDDATIAWLDWGPAERPLALCLHGAREQALFWQPLAEHLLRRGWRVVAFDLPGHGRSSHLQGRRGYSVVDLLHDAHRFMQTIATPALVVGHSFGALLSLPLCSTLRPRPKGLILVEPVLEEFRTARPFAPVNLLSTLATSATPLEHPQLLTEQEAVDRLRAALPALNGSLALAIARRALCTGGERLTWRWDPRLLLPFVEREAIGACIPEYLATLSAEAVPTLAVFGSESPYSPHLSRDLLCKHSPQTAIEMLPAAHHPHLEDQDAFFQIVDRWLDSHLGVMEARR